jgi:hypothetical protein
MLTIYQLYCKNPDIEECYIGSTINYVQRKYDHIRTCSNPNRIRGRIPAYEFISKNGGIENWDFKILNEVEYVDSKWSRMQEQAYITLMKPKLNKFRAYTSPELRNENMKRYTANRIVDPVKKKEHDQKYSQTEKGKASHKKANLIYSQKPEVKLKYAENKRRYAAQKKYLLALNNG